MFTSHSNPSPELLKAVRGGLIIQGTSLARWANDNGVKRQNLTKALLGDWKGQKAAQIVERVTKAAGVNL